MKIIQIIDLDGQPVAIAAGGRAIITDRVPPDQLAHVQAKSLYALQIQAGNRTGPYTDHDAEQYAREIAETHTTRRRDRAGAADATATDHKTHTGPRNDGATAPMPSVPPTAVISRPFRRPLGGSTASSARDSRGQRQLRGRRR
jgi:hypothetical protein